jgi:hypothetical protein
LAFFCGLSAIAFAQEETAATISGKVVDATGALVPKATIVVTNKETGAERRVESNDEGLFTVTPLPPGPYSIAVERTGFKRSVQNLTLNAKDRRPVDVVLEAGVVTETIQVTDEAPPIQESPTGQALVSGAQVRELPLNNRDFLKLLESGIPGVSSDLADETSLGLTNRTSVSINGMRRNGVNYLVDGVNNTDGGSNITLLSTPTIDSIKEFKVLTSNYTAEVGRSGSGTVTVVTRGGSNDFHASLYEFVRNDYFNANSFFNKRTGRNPDGTLKNKVPKLRYNTFGGTLSGPVILPRFGEGGKDHYSGHNKTFFFFSEDGRRIRRAITASTATVPTIAQRAGDFSSSLGLPLFRTSASTPGSCTTPGVGTCTTTPLFVVNTTGSTVQAQAGMVFRADGRAYTGNIIPGSDLSPQALGLLPIWPLPDAGSSFTFSPVNLQNTRQEVIRIDHNFNENHRIYGRYTHDLNITQETGGLFNGINLPNISTTDTRTPGQVMAISFISVVSPSLVNEATYNFSQNFIGSQLVGRGRRSDYGGAPIPEVFPENNANAIPTLTITGITTAGALQGFAIRYRNQVARDVVTWTKDNHTFKFGGEWAFEGKNENSNNNTQGSFGFTTAESRGVSTTGVTLTQTGIALGSFLLGRANSYSESQFDITFHLHLGRREFFAQDTWRIRPNLTLDYGVRYQDFVPATDRKNVIAAFEPELFDRARVPTCLPVATPPAVSICSSLQSGTGNELNGIAVAGAGSPFGRTIVPHDKNNFSPRVGLAWSPDFKNGFGRTLFGENGKTVFRLGYGFYYDQIATFLYEDPTASNPPFTNSASFSGAGITLATPAGGALGNLPVRSIGGVDRNLVTPMIQQWSAGVQHEIFKNAVIDISYVGTKGDHLLDRRNINFVGPAETNAWILDTVRNPTASTNVNAIRPFVGYSTITFIETQAISRYHGLLSSLNWRFARGSSLNVAYTFSKNMTNFTNDRDGVDAPQNQFNLRPEYAEARTSRPHIFAASYIYELPFFRQSKNGFAHYVLSGWQISGITNIESGQPISRVLASSTNSGRNGNRAQLTGNPTGGLAGTVDPVSGLPFIFDPTAFANPVFGTFGNSGRAIFRLPGRNQTNLSLVKNLYLNQEKGRYVQLRAESFNVFNHTQFLPGSVDNQLGGSACVPGGTILVCANPTTGRPTATRLPREFQFGLKLYF